MLKLLIQRRDIIFDARCSICKWGRKCRIRRHLKRRYCPSSDRKRLLNDQVSEGRERQSEAFCGWNRSRLASNCSTHATWSLTKSSRRWASRNRAEKTRTRRDDRANRHQRPIRKSGKQDMALCNYRGPKKFRITNRRLSQCCIAKLYWHYRPSVLVPSRLQMNYAFAIERSKVKVTSYSNRRAVGLPCDYQTR